MLIILGERSVNRAEERVRIKSPEKWSGNSKVKVTGEIVIGKGVRY